MRAKEMGFEYVDITDTNAGGSMLGTAGFSPTISLDDNPFDVLRLFEKHGIKPSTICVHAALLEPSNPGVYGPSEIMKAVKFAAAIGVKEVVTTETDPRSEWARSLTYTEQIFIIAEKLHTPVRMAEDYGVHILLEPHGPIRHPSNQIHWALNGDKLDLYVNGAQVIATASFRNEVRRDAFATKM